MKTEFYSLLAEQHPVAEHGNILPILGAFGVAAMLLAPVVLGALDHHNRNKHTPNPDETESTVHTDYESI